MTAELKKVLLVEDERDIQEIAKIALNVVGGFEIQICSSGKEALAVIGDFEPQVVLLDVMMPEMDGPTTLMNIRKMEPFVQTPVIFMTAKVQASEVRKYTELGALGVIPKPFDPMTLADSVREYWVRFNGSEV